ncbi:hypothetical protein BKA62DRAFT_809276 [Auriculariales sp. MPI-PUGE-AT-0066]|nr:hypothetical protein BKA62DRAFT_809276 [Auriculariales sp. MPI-PUGE-AT-0066]
MLAVSSTIKSSTANTISMARSASKATRIGFKTALSTPTGLISRVPSTSAAHMALSLSHAGSKTPTAATTVNMLTNLTIDDATRPLLSPTLYAMVQTSKTAAPRSPLVQMARPGRPNHKSAFAKACKQNGRKHAADFTLVLPKKRGAAVPDVAARTPIAPPAPKLVQTGGLSLKSAPTKVTNIAHFAELSSRRAAAEVTESPPTGTPTPKAEVQWKSCRDRPPTPYPVGHRSYFN